MEITNIEEEIKLEIKCKNQELENVEQYIYLGTVLTKDGRLDQEVEKRINKTSQDYYSLNNIKKQRLKQKCRFTIRCIFPY
jgi:hypothetical protein